MRLKSTNCLLTPILALVACALAQPALSGHLNIVLEAHLDGRQEVATGSNDNRMVGDPRGAVRGQLRDTLSTDQRSGRRFSRR